MPVVGARPAAAVEVERRSAGRSRRSSGRRARSGPRRAAGAAPSAARIRSFSAGRRTVIRNAIRGGGGRRAPAPRARRRGRRRGRRRSCLRTGGQSKPAASERLAHALALGDRLLDVEPRVAQRGGGDPRRRGRDGRRVAAAVELARDARARRSRSRRAARRGRTPSRASGSRSGSACSAISGDDRLAAVLEVRLVHDDRRVRDARGRAPRSPRARPARRSGCSGCRPRRGRPPPGRR